MNGSLPKLSETHILVVCVVLLILGGVFLGLAYSSETPVTKVGEITEDMSFSHIRVIGKVSDFPSYTTDKYEQRSTIRFPLNDGSGTISVKLSDVVTDEVMKSGNVPGYGQTVEIEGKLSVSEYSKSVTVINPQFLKILTKERDYEELADLSLLNSVASEGKLVKVSGKVKSFANLGFAYSFNVTDGRGEVNVFFQKTFAMVFPQNFYELKGANLTVKGALKWYAQKNYWELLPTTWLDIKILNTTVEKYNSTTISTLLSNPATNLNKLFRLENVVVISVGQYNMTVSDGNNSLFVYSTTQISYWGNIKEGTKVILQGKFVQYGGIYELKVGDNFSDYILEVIG
ncbi:MAG: hypothetical protein N3F63_05015 [Thermoplasmata archaeon]|nr:hypothetical protein [Thermoplasmata archaeon]